MSKLIIDEELEAKRVLSEGFTRNINYYELSLLSKYLREDGQKDTFIRNRLINVCEAYSPYFNYVCYADIINRAVNSSKIFRIKKNVDYIIITSNEIQALKSVPYKIGKILFVMLVIAKKDKFVHVRIKSKPLSLGYFFNYSFGEATKYAKVWMSNEEKDETKYLLDGQRGLISATLRSKDAWRICFADDKSQIAIKVDDFHNIISFFPFFCSICGGEIEKKSNRQKLCIICRKASDANKKIGANKRYYDKKSKTV